MSKKYIFTWEGYSKVRTKEFKEWAESIFGQSLSLDKFVELYMARQKTTSISNTKRKREAKKTYIVLTAAGLIKHPSIFG